MSRLKLRAGRLLPINAALIGLWLPLAALAPAAHAQQQEAEAAAAPQVAAAASPADGAEVAAGASAPVELEEIVVSARRRAETAQSVPIALTAIGEHEIEATGAYTLSQLQQAAPSLQVFSFNPRNTNINIRGLGSNVALTNDGLESGVGVYVDQVYYGRPGISQFDLIDLERVEVLRGPQGTLFGKNTTAGAINISSKLPSFTPEFSGEQSVGNYGYRQSRASASGPISGDSVAGRLSVGYTTRDGFGENIHQGLDQDQRDIYTYENFSSRGQLLFKPSESLSLRLIGDHSRQRQRCCLNFLVDSFTDYDVNPANPTASTTIANNFDTRTARLGYTPVPFKPFARIADADAEFHANMAQEGLSAQLDWTLPVGTLTSVSAWRSWDWDPANDADATGLDVNRKAQQVNRQRQLSQEIRLASEAGGRFDYVTGVYYFHQIVDGYGSFEYGEDAGNWNRAPSNPIPLEVWNAALDGFLATSKSTPKTDSYALFSQGTWHAAERLDITLGLRYTHEDKEGDYSQTQVAGADLSGLTTTQQAQAQAIRNNFNPNITGVHAELSDDAVSGTLNISYRLSDDLLSYATYSRGNKSGGLNLTTLPAGVPLTVDPEKVDHYELGLKSQWLNHAATLNLAAFRTEISDYQSSIVISTGGGPTITYIDNVGKVRSSGVEADLRYTPLQGLILSASGAYIDALYVDYSQAPCPSERKNTGSSCDLSGESLPGTSKWAGSLAADASAPLGALEVFGRADYIYRSSFNTNVSNSRYAEVDAYGLVNLRLGIRPQDQRWELALWSRNLFDKEYFQTLSVTDTGLVSGLPGDPRTWGLTGKLRF
ncbi:MAG: TonB-dependent receptor [Hydrocarboniphaga sp.]|uniref:TonB-dependent receptor n=1 Tax=Hydrocarboniphaga sp. TaxID=2033016 RepID=UPI00262E9B9F|nr:TonB-dependent receptor [Hydrocarboniphaga sp.]MDB5968047.1 TonB-dependent receptor [Hydrocarboniphaga sp.]